MPPPSTYTSVPATVPVAIGPAGTTTTLDFLPGVMTGTEVVLAGNDGRVTVLDLDENRLNSSPVPGQGPPAKAGAPEQGLLVAPDAVIAGHELIVEGMSGLVGTEDGPVFEPDVYAEPDILTGPVTDLGPGSAFFPDAVDLSRVWIVDTSPPRPTVRDMDTTGRTIISPRAVPSGWRPFADTAKGLVLIEVDNGQRPQNFEVWDPTTGKGAAVGRPRLGGACRVEPCARLVCRVQPEQLSPARHRPRYRSEPARAVLRSGLRAGHGHESRRTESRCS